MTILFLVIAALIVVFSFGVGGYLTFFKIPIQNRITQMFAFLMLSLATTAATFVICLSIVWPPIKM